MKDPSQSENERVGICHGNSRKGERVIWKRLGIFGYRWEGKGGRDQKPSL